MKRIPNRYIRPVKLKLGISDLVDIYGIEETEQYLDKISSYVDTPVQERSIKMAKEYLDELKLNKVKGG